MFFVKKFFCQHLFFMLAFSFSVFSNKLDNKNNSKTYREDCNNKDSNKLDNNNNLSNVSVQNQVESYLKGVRYISSDFTQITSNGEVYTGKFWLNKEKDTYVRIKYKSGLNQDMLIINENITILNKNTNKKYCYSIYKSPIYSILSGNINLSKEKFEIIENSSKLIRIKIIKSGSFSGVSVTLIFSKYEKTKNIKNLEAWIVDDGKTETLFSFDIDKLSINDKSKIPNDVFQKF